MSDEITNEVVVETPEQQQAAPANISETLQGVFWGDTQTQGQPEQQQAQPPAVVEEKKEAEPTANEWWKGLEYESEETAKAEIQRLKTVKPAEELKFANEDSKKFFEYLKEGKTDDVYSFLQNQKTLSKLVEGEVNDSNAADIIKFSMKSKYKEFSDSDVERKFNKQYGIPPEPVQKVDELDDEFAERKSEWKARVEDIKADMILDAKVIKPEIEKLKSELVLPDISPNNQAASKEPTQEDLAAIKKQQESFVEATEKYLNTFNGFSANVKDKDVDYTVSYGTSKEEKDLALNLMKEFAESGFNANELFVKDWVTKEGTLNVNKIIEDKMFLLNRDKILQKVANDAANQRLEIYLKDKKNIRIDNSGGKDFGAGEEAKNQSQKLQEAFWGGN